MKSRKNALLAIVAIAVLVVLAAIIGIARNAVGSSVRVTAATASTGTIDPEIFGIGTVEARSAYSVGPTIASRVARVLVDQGDTVSAGQLLAEMDPVDLEERMASSRNAVARAASVVQATGAQVAEAKSKAQVAIASATRFADLQKKGFVSAEAADAKQHEANAAKASLEGAEANHAAAIRDQDRISMDFSGVVKQRAQYRLLSPINGVVQSREAELGSTLVAGQTLFRLLDPRSLWVRTRVDQSRAAGLRVGQSASIVLRSQPSTPIAGTIARIDIASDAVTEERIVNVAIANSPVDLSPGEIAEVTVHLPSLQNVLLIPTAGIRSKNGKTGVFRIKDRQIEYVAVKVGAQSLNGKTQVVDGLAAGDVVVQHVASELRGGEQVSIVESLSK